MLKRYFLLLTVLITSASLAQNINQKWMFESIRLINDTSEKNLKPIADGDYMLLHDDGTFEYELSSIPLIAKGNWELNNQLLTYHYVLPTDTSRSYNINISNNHLLLEENGVLFTFNAAKTEPQKSNRFSLMAILRGLLGMATLIGIAFAFSRNRKGVKWQLVWKGLLIQLIFAVAILKVPLIQNSFEWLSAIFVTVLGFTREGSLFLFGDLIENVNSFGFIFAFQVLPTILFFSALTSVLFYYGILQKIVYAFALFMKKTLNLSGSESLAAAGNIFLGQTESPLLIKPYIDRMTLSELLCLMSGGMATIAGGVLAAYIGFLGGNDPEAQLFFAKHLLAASVMSAPAAVVAAKILLPETEKVNEDMSISEEQLGTNALEAISIGTTQGLKLAVNVGAMLLVFIAFIAMAKYIYNLYSSRCTGDIFCINFFKLSYIIQYPF